MLESERIRAGEMGIARAWHWLSRQAQDAWQLFIAPGIAALLPWSLGYRWLRWLSRHTRLFDEAIIPAKNIAAQSLGLDEELFAQQARLIILLDHCDLYLSLFRFWRKGRPWHVRCRGAWPATGGFIAVTFHYGNGYWIFSTFRDVGRQSGTLYARREPEQFRDLPLRYWYGSLRIREVERVAGRPGIFRPHLRKVFDVLREGVPVTALADLPPRLAPQGQRPVRLLDQAVTMPEGLIKLARSCSVPLVPFWTEFDLEKGIRTLVIGDALSPESSDIALQSLADILDTCIRAAPAGWMFWPEWPQWIADSVAVTAG